LAAPRPHSAASQGPNDLWSFGEAAGEPGRFEHTDVDPVTASTKLYQGTWVTNPGYNQRQSDPGDLAVVLFPKPISGLTPARLPKAGLFD
jgi:hypothetical protein